MTWTAPPVVRTARLDALGTAGERETLQGWLNSGWTGPRVSAYRVTAACLYRADLFRDPPQEEGGALMERARQTWKPNQHGLEYLTELEESFRLA